MMTLGAAITYASLAYLPLSWMQNIGVCLGLALIVIASLATRAGVLGFKPFTNDPLGWRAAKKTYQDDVKDKES